MAEDAPYTIGQVVELLTPTYPDLTVSSLRFLEQEGLVAPGRTVGGHRRYTHADIARVRFIKEMQRRFFPLNLIREMLRRADHQQEPGTNILFRPRFADASFVPLRRTALVDASGLDDARLAAMESLGMITPSAEGTYDEDDLQAARTMKGLADYGLEPDDLAFYLGHLDAIVSEEMQLLIRKVLADRRKEEIGTVILQVEELSNELWRVLHAKVLRQTARRLADQLRAEFGGRI